jgi:FtsP/CotA-like multicopper oxidase with cupredoxin domain
MFYVQKDFAIVAGKPGKWMMLCHLLEHSVSGMDTWFRVS